jgi:DNA-binding IscR family transcriptional regulator
MRKEAVIEPIFTFKDECGYVLTNSDGTHEEVPVRTLAQMRQAMRSLGFVVAHKSKDGGYAIKRRLKP